MVRLVSFKDHDYKPTNPWDWFENMKPCSSGLINCLIPDLDIVIRYNPYYPKLVIMLKSSNGIISPLVEVPFYYSKSVSPARYEVFVDDEFADLEDWDEETF
jgi:hypothetical protein